MAQAVLKEQWIEHREQPGGVACYYCQWQSATDGSFVHEIDELLSGRIMQVVTKPDGVAVPTTYTVTLVAKQGGHDLLHGNTPTRSTSATESALIMDEVTIGANTYADHPVVNECLATLTISGAGDTKKGEVWIFLE